MIAKAVVDFFNNKKQGALVRISWDDKNLNLIGTIETSN